MHWLRLIRWNNLLIIFLTQVVAWWCVILPLQEPPGIPDLLLTPINFLLLSSSTILIAAAGYIINDYFDIRIDAINKPDAVILEKTIPRRAAIIVHSALNALALLLAGIVAWQAQHMEWLLLQVACIVMLWRYSTTWKRQFMIGNVVVALMTALTIMTLMMYEPAIGFKIYGGYRVPAPDMHATGMIAGFLSHSLILLSFAAFAFLLTWMREIIKDLEDYKGDDAEGCLTMPIKWGIHRTIGFVRMLAILSVLMVALCTYGLWHGKFTSPLFLLDLFVTVLLPLILLDDKAGMASWQDRLYAGEPAA